MKNLEKKLEELNKQYQEKRNNLQQAQQMAQRLQTECINLEGQIQAVEELKKDDSKTDNKK